jgi:hypothetical protein
VFVCEDLLFTIYNGPLFTIHNGPFVHASISVSVHVSPQLVPVQVSTNHGADFSSSGVLFFYEPTVSVIAISPDRIESRGGGDGVAVAIAGASDDNRTQRCHSSEIQGCASLCSC